MTPDNSGMPPLPADCLHEDSVIWQAIIARVDAINDRRAELAADRIDAAITEAMHAYGRQVAQMCADLADHVDEPPHYGYENPNTFDDGKRALVAAIRARFNLEKP